MVNQYTLWTYIFIFNFFFFSFLRSFDEFWTSWTILRVSTKTNECSAMRSTLVTTTTSWHCDQIGSLLTCHLRIFGASFNATAKVAPLETLPFKATWRCSGTVPWWWASLISDSASKCNDARMFFQEWSHSRGIHSSRHRLIAE